MRVRYCEDFWRRNRDAFFCCSIRSVFRDLESLVGFVRGFGFFEVFDKVFRSFFCFTGLNCVLISSFFVFVRYFWGLAGVIFCFVVRGLEFFYVCG